MKTWTKPAEVPAGTIVVGWDSSRHSRSALAWAVEHARGERRPVTVVHCISPQVEGEIAVWTDDVRLRQMAANLHDEARDALGEHAPDVEIHALVNVGEARRVLVGLSQRAFMVVVGSHGRGPVRSKVIGSVGVAVVRDAACPVVVVRPHHAGVVRRGVLAALDVDEVALAVAEFAFHEASVLRLPLTVVHCVPVGTPEDLTSDAQRRLSEVLAGLREKYPDVGCTFSVEEGGTEEVVIAQARDRHLTVLGAPHRTSQLLTTTASRIIERSTNPIVVVPGVHAAAQG
jgi:nucleotide-binding universal stress UspA family protein